MRGRSEPEEPVWPAETGAGGGSAAGNGKQMRPPH